MTFKDSKLHGIKIRESANDGSDFGTPDADYRVLYLGEDGLMHLKDAADVITDVGATAPLADHLADAADAHDASAVSILDTAGDFTATDVEGALAELQADNEAHAAAADPHPGYLTTAEGAAAFEPAGAVAAHTADTADAHDASAISFTPNGSIAATDVQAAIQEVRDEASGGSGDVATDAIWDAAGDLAVGSGANTAARLAIGATDGMALQRVSGAVAWALPSGYEFSYVERTTILTVTATVEASADTFVSSAAVAYDGSTRVCIECFSPEYGTGASGVLVVTLWDGATDLGRLALVAGDTAAGRWTGVLRCFLTPSAATHTYHIKAFRSAASAYIEGGAGGTGNRMPAYIRITKA